MGATESESDGAEHARLDSTSSAPTEFLKNGKYLLEGARSAMRGAPPALKASIYVTFVLAILGLGYFALPPYDSTKQFRGLVVIGVFLFLFMILFVLAFARLPRPKVSEITETMRLALRPFLDNARVSVKNRLGAAVADDDIRANVFLPVKVDKGGHERIELRMAPELCIKMQNQAERELVFSPGTGATGHAFQFGEPLIAYRNPTGLRGWDKKYKINAAQAHVIDPELKWIISMPIRGPGRKTLGVANVDGLHHEFNHDVLVECSGLASAFVEMMSRLIMGE